MAALLVGLVAMLLLAGCGDDDTSKDGPTGPTATKLSGTVDLVAEKDGFSKSSATVDAGTVKITVSVPKNATGKHGVGIDGGQYDNVEGAPVGPGLATSLTVAVKKGTTYTIFDSYKNNRDEGYETKLTVK